LRFEPVENLVHGLKSSSYRFCNPVPRLRLHQQHLQSILEVAAAAVAVRIRRFAAQGLLQPCRRLLGCPVQHVFSHGPFRVSAAAANEQRAAVVPEHTFGKGSTRIEELAPQEKTGASVRTMA
jgi:hypothetical protein